MPIPALSSRTALLLAVVLDCGATLAQQQAADAAAPAPAIVRLPNGKPDLSGNWAINANLSDITRSMSRIGDRAVTDDAERIIPYTPVYAQLRAESASRMYEEPELHCYMAGVPSHMWRQAYSGAGLVVQHNEGTIAFLHEFQGARRIVALDGRAHPPADMKFFMGDGTGHWEGDTLVIETTNHNAITWLDLAGNRHSDKLVVTERFTPVDNNTYGYEATFADMDAYTQEWTIAATMTRGADPDAEILEFACIEGNTDNLHYTEDVGGNSEVVR